MRQSDIHFRKSCQIYHSKINKLLKKGEIDQARELMSKVEHAMSQWEEELRSTRFKINILRHIYAELSVKERRANYKIGRRQLEENDSKNDSEE